MYSRSDSTWLKHWDFILLDLATLQVAYMISYMMRMGLESPYRSQLYLSIGAVICLADIAVIFFTEPYHGIMRRGYYVEFLNVIRHVFLVSVLEISYLFLSQNATPFSRLSFVWFIPVAVVLLYLERILWKRHLIRHKKLFYDKLKMILLTTRDEAATFLKDLQDNSFNEYEVAGVAYVDAVPERGETVSSIPVVSTARGLIDRIQKEWVDSIFVRVKDRSLLPPGLLEKCIDMGITVHSCLEGAEEWTSNQYINRMGGHTVLTSSVRVVSAKQVAAKRALDICGGIVGLFITGVLTIFLGPAIYLSSPGPIFFSQTRIGKNGKKFKIYKFRSMYMDAEKRKKELMEQNEMKGFMFKMKADPRIIGSGKDGTRHGLGWFIRKTSLDEFPQFWNVLKGDMSLVGLRDIIGTTKNNLCFSMV